MKILLTLNDKPDTPLDEAWKKREAARAVLLDDDGHIPLLYVSNLNYHKLPGGGIDEGEDKMQGLARECLEEVGSEVEIQGEVGQVTEYRHKWKLHQESYCYAGRILSTGEPSFTDEELQKGFELKWMSPQEALETIASDTPTDYEGGFIQKRDLALLRQYIKLQA